MHPGRIQRPLGHRLVLLVAVVHIQCVFGEDGRANVVLVVGIAGVIFLMSLTYFTVNIVYYHCVHKKQCTIETNGKVDDVSCVQSAKPQGGEPARLDNRADNVPEVIGERNLVADTSQADIQESARPPQGLNCECVSIIPEAGGIGEFSVGASADAAHTRPRPLQHPLKSGCISKTLSNREVDSMLSEAQAPISRCCAVWDWCSPGWTAEGGLPPAVAAPAAGPPRAPQAPTSMPRGRLRL
jgi:hypothetical protein